MPTPARFLVVEDDAAVRRTLAETLAADGHFVQAAASAEAALGLAAADPPDIVLSDIRMPGMDGIELLKLLRERVPSADVVLITAYEDLDTVARAMREGAYDFLVKPLRLAQLRETWRRLLEDRRARGGAARASAVAVDDGIDTLVGRHPAMIEIYKRIGQVAASRVNVLILGETGTGKERVARAIHQHSPFAHEPFLAVNCTALPESLLESELFGHVKGAFTGAVGERRGRFALAGRGTIFLDEIGDTSAAFQAKLLRVLDEREFYPVGAERPARTSARVVVATNRDLDALVSAGTFREDLYYRLRVVEIRIPPLRDRLSDVPLLVTHFVRKTAAQLGRTEATVPSESLDRLLRHEWRGNVRELEHCISRAAILASGGVIRPEHLELEDAPPAVESGDGLPRLEDLERVHLERALATTGGNRTRAAELLGVSRPKLYRMLQKHGLE